MNRVLSQEVVPLLLEHRSLLLDMDDDSCIFAHESSDVNDPSTCSDDVQERVLGCAHSGNIRLLNAIGDLQTYGILQEPEAEDMRRSIRETNLPLVRLDFSASHQYEYSPSLDQQTINEHVSLINTKAMILHRLVALIDDQCGVF